MKKKKQNNISDIIKEARERERVILFMCILKDKYLKSLSLLVN